MLESYAICPALDMVGISCLFCAGKIERSFKKRYCHLLSYLIMAICSLNKLNEFDWNGLTKLRLHFSQAEILEYEGELPYKSSCYSAYFNYFKTMYRIYTHTLLSAGAMPLSRRERVARLDALSRLLDVAFIVPGTNIRFGIDAFIGLIPGIGDFLSMLCSLYIIREVRELGVPKYILAKMVGNVFLDTLIGIIPFIGDMFDAAWKSNRRNMKLLNYWLQINNGQEILVR